MSEAPLVNGAQAHSNNTEDPFFVFRSDLLSKLELVDEHLAELERVVQDQDTIKSRSAKRSLKKSIKDASSTYKDLETCVQLSSASLSENEMYERTCFAKACQDRLDQARQQLGHRNVVTANGNGSYDRVSLVGSAAAAANEDHHLGPTTHTVASMPPPSHNYNNTSQPPQRAALQMLQQSQEDTLDELDAAVTRVGYMAENMNEEIDHQNKLLDHMETDLDEAQEELGAVMGKLSDFLGTKDRFQLCTILILFGIAILLIVLVVYS